MARSAIALFAAFVMVGRCLADPMPSGHDMSSAMQGMSHSQASFSPLKSSAALPPSMGEGQAGRYGADEVARRAYADTRIEEVGGHERRLARQFHGPLVRAEQGARERSIVATGVLEVNEDTLFETIVTQSGLVEKLYVFPGQFTARGQPILSVFSPERINAQHMFLADFSNDPGNQTSLQYYSSFGSAKQYLKQSESNLRWWGFTDPEIKQLLQTGKVRPDYVVSSPRSGYVIDMPKSTGDVLVAGGRDEENFVLPGDAILRGADLRSTWAMLFVKPDDFASFSVGQAVDMIVGEGDGRREVRGVVVHKHEYVSGTTRHADFHVILNNMDGSLRPGTFVALRKKSMVSGIWIPASAILRLADGDYVIRRDKSGFTLTPVKTDFEAGQGVRVVRGLRADDRVLADPRSEIDPDSQTAWLESWY